MSLVAREFEKLAAVLPGISGHAPRLSALAQALDEALDTIQTEDEALKLTASEGNRPRILLDKYWAPFKLALHPSMPARVRAGALDTLQRLGAHQLFRGSLLSHQREEPGDAASTLEPSATATATSALAAYFSGSARRASLSNTGTETLVLDLNAWDSFLLGQDTVPSVEHTELLIDDVIHTLCSCFSVSNTADDPLQLSVIKVLLTLLTSPLVEIHGASLIKVMQTLFHIHTLSRHPVHISTAKASLTQMMNVIVARMERVVAAAASGHAKASLATPVKDNGSVVEEPDKEGSSFGPSDSISSLEESVMEAAGAIGKITGELPSSGPSEAVSPGSHHGATFGEETADIPSENEVAADLPTVSEDSLGQPEVSLEQEQQGSEPSRHVQALEMEATLESCVTEGTVENEAHEDSASPTLEGLSGHNPYSPDPSFYVSLCQNDVYLALRFLSGMSISTTGKPGLAETDSVVSSTLSIDQLSPAALKARLLALELLLSIFANAGQFLASSQNQNVILIAKQYICFAISKNAMGTNPDLFELAMSIFLMVLRFYLPSLKHEMGVLLNSVFLHLLEMDNSSYKQKNVILQGLLKICETPQILVDLFINYDCDFAAASIFERMVNTCVKIAQGKHLHLPPPSGLMSLASAAGFDSRAEAKSQEQRLRLRALYVLVAVVMSLVGWTSDLASNVNVFQAMPGTVKESGKSSPQAEDPMPVFVDKRPMRGIKLSSGIELADPNPSPASSDDTAHMVEERTSKKQSLKHATRIFNSKPNKGIRLLAKLELFDPLDPTSIATFFKSMPELTKSAIGEYLGDGDPFNIQVMHAFIDLFDFSSTPFVTALRTFLQSFRLPGEAQKIDRIMEKFADRFVETFPGIFAKADTAYTLAFSIMMLNTDQHSPSIKHRMDKAAFIRMNRGINDEQDLSEDFLSSIFDEINSNEIVLEDEKSGKVSQVAMRLGAGGLNEAQRLQLYKQEIMVLEKKSRQLINSAEMSYSQTPFKSVKQPEVARPMFSMICWPLMASFGLLFESSLSSEDIDISQDASQRLETDASPETPNPGKDFAFALSADAPQVVDICLQGFVASILVASIFQMETERDALVSSLTNLTALSHLSSMKPKNVKAIKSLLMIANSLGEYLQSSWTQILKVVSQLERIQTFEERMASLDRTSSHKSVDSKHPSKLSGAFEEPVDLLKNNPVLAELVFEYQSQSSQITVDRIFTNSTKLSANAILHFFKCMCQVSLEEVGLSVFPTPGGVSFSVSSQQSFQPRMYLLQKLVETASYNLHRIRYEWTQLWRLLQPHFNAVASHPNISVARFAVDSLRQLSMKFLEKEELSNYSSQLEFLNNFEWIMKNTPIIEIQDLILSSMSQMVTARADHIRSGWKSIFVVLSQVTKGEVNEGLVRFAFTIVESIFQLHFHVIYSTRSFVEYTACLSEFARMQEGFGVDDIILSSLQLLKNCAGELMKTIPAERLSPSTQGTHRRASSLSSPSLDVRGLLEEEHFHLEWAPLFSAFSKVAINSRSVAIRTKAIETLYELLLECGHLFDCKYWKALHRNVLFPIFEDLKELGSDKSKRESNNTVWISGTRLWVECSTSFFSEILKGAGHEVIDCLLKMLVDMMAMNDDMLALCGQVCFSQWVQNNYRKVASSDTWRVIVDHIELAFYGTLPAELVQCQFRGRTEDDEGDSIPPSFLVGMGVINGRILFERGRQIATRVYPSSITVEQLDFDHTIIKCVTHVEWVQSLGAILLEILAGKESGQILSLISGPLLERLLVYFYESYIIARYFNVYYDLRYAIWKAKGTKNISNLAKQETASLSTYIRLLFALYRTEGDMQVKHEYGGFNSVSLSELIIQETMDVFHRYIESVNDKSKNQRDVSTCGPVVAVVFLELISMPWWSTKTAGESSLSPSDDMPPVSPRFHVLQRQLPVFFKLGIKIIMMAPSEVQLCIQEFLEKMGDEYIRIPM